MIEIDSLAKSYKKQPALNNVSLNIDKPGIYSVLGPNGSGKTTLIKTILGIVHKDSGSVKINGTDTKPGIQYLRNVTYQPQAARFPENLAMGQVISMIEDIRGEKGNYEEIMELFGLNNHRKKSIKSLSGGSRQKFNILLAIMFDSPVIIFDEPTTGLDPLAIIKFKKILNERKEMGKYILLTSHDIHFVESITDFIIFLLEGEVRFFGTTDEINARAGRNTLEESIAVLLGGGK